MIKNFLNTFKTFDSFLKWQLFIGFFGSLTWALIIPLMNKLQGLYWTTAFISISYMFNNFAGFIIPLFKGIKLNKIMLFYILTSVVYLFSLSFYFININAFLIIESIVSFCFCICYPVLAISWELYVIKKYNIETFENFRYWEGIRSSFGHILGSIIIAIITLFFDIKSTLIITSVFLFLMIIIQLFNWFKFYKNIE